MFREKTQFKSPQEVITFIETPGLPFKELIQAVFDSCYHKRSFTRAEKEEIKSAALKTLEPLDASYAEWSGAYEWMTYDPADDLKHLFAERMVEKASAFKHWKAMLRRCVCFGKYQETIINGLSTSAETIEQAVFAYSQAPEGSEYQSKALETAIGLIVDFKTWVKATTISPRETMLREKVFEMIDTLPVTFPEIWRVYRRCSFKTREIQPLLKKKIAEMDLPFDDWCKVYQNSKAECPLKKTAFRKMNEKMKTA